jgi:succinate-acetate transporter protein
MASIIVPTPETASATTNRPFAAGIADPGPLGLGAFAMTTFVLSCFNAGFFPKSVEGVVLGLALFYGGIAQVLAGMWEFVKGNTFGAVAFTSYGAFWLSFWYLVAHVDLSAAAPGDAAKGVGVFLLAWTIFTLYMLVCTLRTNTVLVAVFGVLFLTFVFLTWGEFSGTTGITRIGGYLGLLTAVLAWYGSMAGVMNATAKHAVLPVFPRS